MAGSGFGPDFFEEAMGGASNPLREFLGTIKPGPPPPLLFPSGYGLGQDTGSPRDMYAAIAPSNGVGFLTRAKNPEGTVPTSAPNGGGFVARAKKKAAEAAQTASGGGSELDASYDTNNPLYTRATEIAREEGVDPLIFARLIAVESRYNPNAYNTRSGAGGLTGLMPTTATSVGVTNVFDPEQALRGGAKYLRQMVDRYGGDYVKALAAYNAGPGNVDQYQGVPPFEETQKYVRAISGQGGALTPQARSQPQAQGPGDALMVPTPPAGTRPLKGITTAQYGEEGLATGAADYICGPIAAQAFARAQGRNPTLRESLDLARQIGVIDPENGMHGVESTATLIRRLGGQATVEYKLDKNRIMQEIAAGRPVIVDTDGGSRGHYFVIEGYDPTTDRFDFGNSALALRASRGQQYWSLDQIRTLGFGSPHAAIYAR